MISKGYGFLQLKALVITLLAMVMGYLNTQRPRELRWYWRAWGVSKGCLGQTPLVGAGAALPQVHGPAQGPAAPAHSRPPARRIGIYYPFNVFLKNFLSTLVKT